MFAVPQHNNDLNIAQVQYLNDLSVSGIQPWWLGGRVFA